LVSYQTTSETPHVAVVIVSWNNESIIGGCLESVCGQTYPSTHLHTYVVDNASSDSTCSIVAEKFPHVTVVQTGWNSGFAFANNRGIERAQNDRQHTYVVLLNSDATLGVNWVETLVAHAETRPRGACFQGLTLDYWNTEHQDSHHVFLNSGLQAVQAGYGQPITATPTERVFGVNAAAAMYSTAFFREQPFDEVLDERMFMYLEDVELSLRALVMGWENWFVAGATAFHMGSASTKTRANGFALGQTWRNQTVLFVTHLPWSNLIRSLPALFHHDRGALNHLRFTGQRAAIPAAIRGRLAGFLLVPYALGKRRKMAAVNAVPFSSVEVFMRTGTLSP
jgi:GT2 family glycosyltransferase